MKSYRSDEHPKEYFLPVNTRDLSFGSKSQKPIQYICMFSCRIVRATMCHLFSTWKSRDAEIEVGCETEVELLEQRRSPFATTGSCHSESALCKMSRNIISNAPSCSAERMYWTILSCLLVLRIRDQRRQVRVVRVESLEVKACTCLWILQQKNLVNWKHKL